MNFKIMVDDEQHLYKFLADYNKREDTDFEVVGIIADEVTFAELKTEHASSEALLKLGIEYGKQNALMRIN